MAEAEKPKNGKNCDTPRDTNVINHDGSVAKNKVDNLAAVSLDKGSHEASKVVDKGRNNASEKAEKGNTNLSEPTKSSVPVEIPPLISVAEQKKTADTSKEYNLTKENSLCEKLVSKKDPDVASENNIKKVTSINKISNVSNGDNDEDISKKNSSTSINADKMTNDLDNKHRSPPTTKTPPPLPRRQSEKVGIDKHVWFKCIAIKDDA